MSKKTDKTNKLYNDICIEHIEKKGELINLLQKNNIDPLIGVELFLQKTPKILELMCNHLNKSFDLPKAAIDSMSPVVFESYSSSIKMVDELEKLKNNLRGASEIVAAANIALEMFNRSKK